MIEYIGIIVASIAAISVVIFGGRGLVDLKRHQTRKNGSSLDEAPEAGPVETAATIDALPEQDIRFCTTADGVRLAYSVVGEGYPVFKLPNWLTHLEFDWNSPVWRHWSAELAQNHRLVRYDQRGCGLSDRTVEDLSTEAVESDLETIIDTVDFDRFALIGISQSAATAIGYAVRHPDRVSHLILCGSFPVGWGHSTGTIAEEWEALLTLTQHGWGRDDPAYRQLFTSKFMPDATPEQMHWFNDMQKMSTSGDNAVRIQRANAFMDIRPLLPQVSVATLVLHCRGDAIVPFELGRQVASAIPGARFVPLNSNNHLVIESEPAWQVCLSEIQRFLQDVN